MCQERALLEFTPDNPLYLDLQQPAALKLAVKGLKSIAVKAREGRGKGWEGAKERSREGKSTTAGNIGQQTYFISCLLAIIGKSFSFCL